MSGVVADDRIPTPALMWANWRSMALGLLLAGEDVVLLLL